MSGLTARPFWFAAVGLGLLQALVTWRCLMSLPHLPCTDGYYLLLQAQSVINTGHLKIPDNNVVPYVVAGFMRSGFSATAAIAVVLGLIQGLYCASVCALYLRNQTARLWTGVGLIGVVTTLGLYHALEFPKLTLAVALIPWWLIGRPRPLLSMLIGGTMMLAAVMIHPAAIRSSMAGPPGIWVFLQRKNFPHLLQIEAALLLLALAYHLRRASTRLRVGLVILLLLTFLPTSRLEMFGLGERYVFLAALCALPLLLALRSAAATTAKHAKSLPTLCALLSIGIGLSGFWQRAILHKYLLRYDYAMFDRIVDFAVPLHAQLLIAFRPLSFYYTARTGRDAFFFDPEPNWKQDKIWRVVMDVSLEEVVYFVDRRALQENLIRPIPQTSTWLVREDCWEAIRRRVSPVDVPGLYDRLWNNEHNPSAPRPAFLRARHLHSVQP